MGLVTSRGSYVYLSLTGAALPLVGRRDWALRGGWDVCNDAFAMLALPVSCQPYEFLPNSVALFEWLNGGWRLVS